MNILFYISRFPGYGGIETVTNTLANYFAEKLGYCVTIVSVEGQTGVRIDGLNQNISLHFLPYQISDERNISFFNAIIKEKKIDFIIYQDSYAPTEKLLFSIPTENKPSIVIVEHNTPNCFLKEFCCDLKNRKVRERVLFPLYYAKIFYKVATRHRKLYKLCDKYVLLSDAYKKIFMKVSCIFNIKKLVAITNPLTLPEFCDQDGIQKEKVCLFIGRLASQKGVDKLLKIWQIIESRSQEWRLAIVGDGEKRTWMETYVKQHNLNRIDFLGYQSDPSPFYKKSSILTMSSIFEGYPLSLVEAMNYGTIPITFNSYASAKSIIDDGINGFLIEPFKINKYVEMLLDLFEKDFKRDDMSRAAMIKSKTFLTPQIAMQWENLFKEMVYIERNKTRG